MPHLSRPALSLFLLLALAGGVIVGGTAGLLVGFKIGKGKAAALPPAEPGDPAEVAKADAPKDGRRVYTRAEFRRLVLGKDPSQVVAAVGRPDQTHQTEGFFHWYYDGRTVDPATGKTDSTARLRIEGGEVVSISYPERSP